LQHITAITSRSELNRKLKPHSIVHRQMPASPTSTKSGAIPRPYSLMRNVGIEDENIVISGKYPV